MYQCVINFHHSVDHGDLDSITRLNSLEHIRVVLIGYYSSQYSSVIEVSISKV